VNPIEKKLSSLDYSKCELPRMSDNWASAANSAPPKIIAWWDTPHRNVVLGIVGYSKPVYAKFNNVSWRLIETHGGFSSEDLEALMAATTITDQFIESNGEHRLPSTSLPEGQHWELDELGRAGVYNRENEWIIDVPSDKEERDLRAVSVAAFDELYANAT
jgi:hypothetical protein